MNRRVLKEIGAYSESDKVLPVRLRDRLRLRYPNNREACQILGSESGSKWKSSSLAGNRSKDGLVCGFCRRERECELTLT